MISHLYYSKRKNSSYRRVKMQQTRLFFDSVITSFLVSVIVSIGLYFTAMDEYSIAIDFHGLTVFFGFAICFISCSLIISPMYYFIRKLKCPKVVEILCFNGIGLITISLILFNLNSFDQKIFLPFFLVFPCFILISNGVSSFITKNNIIAHQ